MEKPLIVVTGASGQLGFCLRQIAPNYTNYNFLFATREQLDLSNLQSIKSFFVQYKPAFFINCAAYTAVDKAENEQEFALTINATAVGEIAQQCAIIKATLITISTDYVFDGNGTSPYLETSNTSPINYYGYTKWLGEKLAIENNPKTIIIRTSWVYALHGNNFVKTMLRLMKERDEINVVADQIGCPTYAPDLAIAIVEIIQQLPSNPKFGIYHYSNTGAISWFQFATAIKELSKLNCIVNPIPSSAYSTPAKRPTYSVMDLSAIENDFSIIPTDWKTSLVNFFERLA